MNAEIKNMTEEQITDLKAQIADWEKAKERKPLVFRPSSMESYWGIRGKSSLRVVSYGNLTQSITDAMIKDGNCFRTEALAEAELKRRQVVRQIEECVDKYDAERGGAFIAGGNNYTFVYDAEGGKVLPDWWGSNVYNPMLPSFSSREIAERILEEVGEDNIKLLFMKYPIIKEEE